MTSVRRPYINNIFNQKVDDGCLEYKSIPMAVVNDIVKVTHEINDFTGIKQIYNLIPPRPKNINAMATSIARINNLPYSVVDGIAKKFIADEVAETRRFVASAPSETLPEPLMYEPYITENPTQSSTGSRLAPEKETNRSMVNNPKYNRTEQVSFILGDLNPTSGVVPFNVSSETQTEWVTSREKGFSQISSRKFGELAGGFAGIFDSGDAFTQTNLSKPSSGKNMNESTYSIQSFPTFFIGNEPEQRKGTFEGTPARHLNRGDKAQRIAQGILPHTPKRPDFSGDSATSGYTTPLK